ncbi:MAG: PKD domain-containing protein [Ferruginibacter sp.]
MKKPTCNTCRYKKSFVLSVLLLCCIAGIAQPSANFTANPLSGCAPLVVTFTDQSTGSPTSWQWDLGNGTLSTQQSPTTTYFNSGFYTVTLTVTNASGSNTTTKLQYIKLDDKPVVDFSPSITAGCFPLRVNFTDMSLGGSAAIISWEWDFGDGFLSTAQSPFHTYTAAGTYSVTLKVTNTGGCSKTVSRPNYIQVSPGVTVDFSNTQPQLCKPPETINFTNLSTGPGTLSYEWDFGDGNNSLQTNPLNTYLTGGSFTVRLITQSSAGCVDTLIKNNLIVIRDVVSDFTGPTTICQGVTANFVNTSIPASVSSLWDFGDNTFSTATNPSKAYSTPGVYNIKLKNNYGSCADSTTHQITVLALPTPNFSAPDVTDCNVPFTVNFNDLSTGATGWSLGFW